VPVYLNIYWQRPVAYDEQGRAQRRMGGDDLSWHQRLVKDVLGVYHVGVEVHGVEYGFGNYRAPGCRQLGGVDSGVFSHEPQRPGPHCVFKQAERLGYTSVTAGEADDLCAALGNNEFGKANYNKFHKNCVDFARALAAKLGSEDVPSWCYRGQAIGKALGLGGPDPEDSYENGLESGAQSPAVPIGAMSGSLAAPIGDAQAVSSRKPQDSMSAAIELASKSLSGTYVAPPPMPAGIQLKETVGMYPSHS
jgi:hypothetical protein